MHPARFDMLKRRYAVPRKVVFKEWTASHWILSLECGHTLHTNPTMKPGDEQRCARCGEAVVRERHPEEFDHD